MRLDEIEWNMFHFFSHSFVSFSMASASASSVGLCALAGRQEVSAEFLTVLFSPVYVSRRHPTIDQITSQRFFAEPAHAYTRVVLLWEQFSPSTSPDFVPMSTLTLVLAHMLNLPRRLVTLSDLAILLFPPTASRVEKFLARVSFLSGWTWNASRFRISGDEMLWRHSQFIKPEQLATESQSVDAN